MATIEELRKKHGVKPRAKPIRVQRTTTQQKSIDEIRKAHGVKPRTTRTLRPQVPAKQESASLKERMYELGKDIVLGVPRALAMPFASLQEAYRVHKGGTEKGALEKFAFRGTEFGTKERAGVALEGAVDLGAGLLFGGATGRVGKEIAETGLKQVGKNLVKKPAKEIAKTVATDVGVGGLYGASGALQKDQELPEALKTIGAGMLVGAALPPVLGKTLKIGGKITKEAAGIVGEGAEKIASGLEKYVEKRLSKEHLTDLPVGKVIAKAEGSKAFAPTVAKKIAEGIRFAQELPYKFNKAMLDPSAGIRRTFKEAEPLGLSEKRSKELLQDFEGTRSRGGASAGEKFKEYASIRNKYADVGPEAKVYARSLDMLDRLNLGQEIEGGLTRKDVVETIKSIRNSMPAKDFKRVVAFVGEHNNFWDRQLRELAEIGRITPDEYKYIRAAHPNYIPSRILDNTSMAVETPFAVGGQRKAALEKAHGSKLEREDMDTVVADNLFANEIFKEENRVNREIVESLMNTGMVRPIITAENVRLRTSYYNTLKDMQIELKQLLKDKRFLNKASKEETKRINKLYEKLKADEDKLFKEVSTLKGEDDDIEKLYYEMAARQAKEDSLADIAFKNPSVEDYYIKFKKAFNRNPKLRDVGDAEQLKKLRPELYRNIEDAGRLSNLEMTTDDMLNTFRERYFFERGVPKADKGFLRKYHAQEKRAFKAEEKVAEREGKILSRKKSKGYYDGRIEQINKEVESINAAKRTIYDDLSEIRKVVNQEIEPGYKAIRVWRDGVEEKYALPTDLAEVMSKTDHQRARWLSNFLQNTAVGKVLRFPANMVRYLAVTVNPFFAFKNVARDFQTTKVTARNSLYSTLRGLVTAFTRGRSEKAAKLYDDVAKHGGILGNIYDEFKNPRDMIRTLIKDRNNPGGIFGKLIKFPGSVRKFTEEFGQKFEEAARISVFYQARKAGLSAKEAGYIARNATIDFGKVAPWMRPLNQIVPFLNARVQGFRNTLSVLGKDPEKFVRMGLYTSVYPATVLYKWNTQFDSYDLIPDYEKRLFWVIVVGESKGVDNKGRTIKVPHYLKIPKGESQIAITALTDRFYDVARKEEPEEFNRFTRDLVGDISPISLDVSAAGPIAMPFEIAANKKFFTGASIEPRGQKFAKPIGFRWREDIPTELRYKETTTEVAKELSKFIDGKLGLSPARIDYLISQGILGDILRVPELFGFRAYPGDVPIKRQIESAFEKYSQMPGLRAFMGTRNYQDVLDKKEKEQEIIQRKIKEEYEKRFK